MSPQHRKRPSGPAALLSVGEAAIRLGVHPNTIRSWADEGRLGTYRINARGDRRFRASDVERLLVEEPTPMAHGNGAVAAAEDVGLGETLRDGRMAVLARLVRGASGTNGVTAAARTAVEALRTEGGYARAAVYVGAEDTLVLESHGGYRIAPVAEVTSTSTDSIVNGEHTARAELPLRFGRGLVGLLVVESDGAEALADDHMPFLRTVAAGLAATIQNARLLTRARREVQRAGVLRRVTHELTGQLDPGRVLADIVDRTRSLFDADKAGLWLLGDGDRPFQIAAQRGLSDDFLSHISALNLDSQTIGVRALRERRTYWMPNADRDPDIGTTRAAYAAEGIKTVCLAPLVGRDKPLGIIGLYHLRDRAWPDDEISLVQAFASQAAVAIENARLYGSVADQAARMRSIQDLSARLNRLTDVRAIAEAIVAEASTLADYNDIRVYNVDWDRRVCDAVAFTRDMLGEDANDTAERLRVAVGEGFTGWVAEHGEPLLVNDALADERGKQIDGTDAIDESLLAVPMLYEGRALGVIVLSQLGVDRFTPDDVQTMTIFAGYAAQAIANATAYERLADQSDQLARQLDSQRRLLEINERLLSTYDQETVLQLIADGLHSVVAYDNLSIFRADRVRRCLLPVLAREAYIDEVMSLVVPFGRGLMGWVVEHGEPVLANDALADPRAIQIPGTPADPEAIIVVPLVAGDEVIGAMNVGRIGGEEVYFSHADFELVKLFASQAATAMRNADAHRAVSLQAETDALTGLANHGAFQRDLARLLSETDAATGEPRLALLMMDLDRFKAYNDRFGHPAGDALLHAAATAIYAAARSEDRVYRYGGDEFALILPGATVSAAERVASRVRRAVSRLATRDASHVTITVGVAAVPHDAADRDALLAAADAALYFGKQAGSNRVVRADEVPRDSLDLRGTLAQLARAALRGSDEQAAVEHLVERAARLSGRHDGRRASVRDALLAVARSLEGRDAAARGHGDRVGRLVLRLAERLDLDPDQGRTLELAARLHSLEEAGVNELDAIPSLRDVGQLIREYRALMQAGGRRRRRGRRARGSVGAHLVAAADSYDELLTGVRGPRVGRAVALQQLRQDPGTFRVDVIDALADLVADRPDRGRRRRRSDTPLEIAGAA